MSESPASPSDDAPLISDDFLQGDVRAGLDRMRKRLLDLTARNRLLNFPQRASKTSLRTVDELPDQLFGHLTNGKDLTFKSVPRPKGHRIPIDDQFGLEADESGESTRLAGPRYPPAKDHAERIGLATSFDLPPASSDPLGDHHTDRAIQTLHYPEDLEVILRKVAGAARLAIEETGSNMLYLVFGFLEWYESDDSDQARFAPLMLLPVALEKGGADDAGTIRYSLRQSGEDVATNVSLQERLRRDFGVEIPQLAEDDTPESYFAKLAFLPDLHPRWRVRRQVTLTLLSFGKILMYRDLDPDTWPKGSSPAEHARITEFFRGIQNDSITFAEEYSLDDVKLRQHVPMLVDEADSSQHSALVDAMAGKNLVIQGPPGTGKSQTITNLIASALAAGKTVLFVSDKLAALEVVRDRLDRVGMGTFCLELHSHKAQKRQILEDVEQRLQSYGSFRDPAQLDSKLGSIATDKELLTSYAELINRPFGALGRTLHDIVWGARRQRAGLPFPPDLVEGIAIKRASAITPEVLADHHQESVQFATHLRNVLGTCDSVRHHPWFGVRNAELTFADETTVTTLLGAWKTACSELIDAVRHANEFAGVTLLGDSLSSLKQIAEDARQLPETAGGIIPELLTTLWRKDVRACLTEFMRWVGEYRRTIDAITQLVGIVPNLSPAQVAELQPLVARGQDMLPKATVVGDFAAGAADCHFAASEIQRARIVLEQITRTLRVDIPFTQEGVAVTLAALAVIEATPLDALHLRSTGLDLPGAQESLAAAEGEAAFLMTRRDALGKRLDLSLLPPTSELRSHITATANARWWSVLSKDYRAAKRAYVGMARDSQRASNIEMREGFRRVHEFTGAEQRFGTNQTYRALAGAHFNGIDSPFDKLRLLTLWRSDAESELARFTELGSSVGSAVWGASAEQLRSLHNTTSPASALASCFRSGGEAIDKAAGVMHAGVSATEGDWHTVGKALEEVGAELASVAASFQSAGMPERLPTDKVHELVGGMTELRSLAQLIGATAAVRDALQTHYQGTATDLGRIARTIAFFDAIVSGPVPKSVKEWILHPDVEARLAHVRASVALVRVKVPALEARWEAFAHLVDLDQSQWFGTDHLGKLTLQGHVERVDRAVAHRELLAAWLDYLRSRRPIVERGLNEIAELAERRQIDVDAVSSAVAFVVLNSLVREAFASHQQLARFSGLSHEQVRLRFAKFDREAIALYRERAAKLADGRPVPAGIGSGSVRTYTERHLLDREISKQRAHIPLRQLMLRAGRALQALKPCFMMGPLSVAQYLTPGAVTFDIVVMDEASQLRPEDALGSIARAAQVVVVGDRMQLPPTSFFDRIGDDSDQADEDAGAVAEAESILDIASATYKPSRLLRWHYRSRHGSLIAFSNKEFYRGNLVVFPSPIPVSPVLGVKLVHVKDGVYESSRNVTEARRVVDTAIRFMERQPTESLGLVAMNAPQRELIEDLIDSAVKRSEPAQRYIAERAASLEPFFVKNLENVQGDERDVIYISNTYGRSATGQVFQRFGPINGPTGHRRLNVLFTRARNRVVLFSSMLAEDILTQPTSSWGVRALKGYLHYAQTGVLETASFSGREPDSDFEIEVSDALRHRGYDVVAQVGIAGYFIDLAVRHPRKVDSFILGIECDGMTYHSGRSARDRDRLRQQVLEGLGWNIHRIWSTDWFKQTRTEVDRVVQRIEELLRREDAVAATFGPDSTADFETSGSVPETVGGVGAANDSWQGEIALQPMSEDDARQELTALRDDLLVEFPNVPADESILRGDMIAAFLLTRPRSKEDWLRQIPFDLRMATHGDQLACLNRILAITSRLAT